MAKKAPCYLIDATAQINDSEVSRHVFQTWDTEKRPLTAGMQAASQSWQTLNPEWDYQLFDNSRQRAMIETYFHSDVLIAYDALVPGAYQADLWRYCVLYLYGGVYADIKLHARMPMPSLLSHDETWLVSCDAYNPQRGAFQGYLYQAFLVARARHPVLRHAIAMVVDRVQLGYYGTDPLLPTGPGLLGQALNAALCRPFNAPHHPGVFELLGQKYCLLPTPDFSKGHVLDSKGRVICHAYEGYKKERVQGSQSVDVLRKYDYALCWMQDAIYTHGRVVRDETTQQRKKRLQKACAVVARGLYRNQAKDEARRQVKAALKSGLGSLRLLKTWFMYDLLRCRD